MNTFLYATVPTALVELISKPNELVFDKSSPVLINLLYGHPSSSLWVGSLSASLDGTGTSGPAASQLQFSVPMQGGTDGISPQRSVLKSVNEAAVPFPILEYDLATAVAALAGTGLV